MTTLLDEPAVASVSNGRYTFEAESPADVLRSTMAAVRVSFVWLGIRKTLTAEQKQQAADGFGAEGAFLSAGKKLLDTSHPAFKAVTAIRSRVVAYWKGISLPYPEAGIRLIRQRDVAPFDVQLTTQRQELEEAVAGLDRHYNELKLAARNRLGSLYDASDYPLSLIGMFALSWEFPSVEPPDYLRQLSPALYEEESRRAANRFNEAVQLAEQAFAGELARLTSHLAERLSGEADGKPKVFRDSVLENFGEFFERFKTLNVHSSAALDQVVDQARALLRGVQPQELRDSQALRQDVAANFERVQARLDDLLVDRPRRNILRRGR